MDKDEGRTLPSLSSVRSVVINEGEVAAAAGNATTTTTREEVLAMKVHATAEQIRAVFSNGLVSSKFKSPYDNIRNFIVKLIIIMLSFRSRII